MTKYQNARQLRSELLSRGYSASYVDRVIAELEDHRLSILENSSGHMPNNSISSMVQADEQLGLHSTFLDSFDEYPELMPWPQRHPLWMFVVFPCVSLCFSTALTIFAAEAVARSESIRIPGLGQFAPGGHWWLTMSICLLLAGFFALTALRSRVPWGFLVTSLLLISLSGLFVTEIGNCSQSKSTIVYSHFGFDFWRNVVPIVICIFGVGVARGQQVPAIKEFAAGKRTVADLPNTPKRKIQLAILVIVPLAAALVVTLFFHSATLIAKGARPHEADKFIPRIVSETRRAFDTISLLGHPVVTADLETDQKQQTSIDVTIGEWEQFKSAQQELHLPKPPSMAEYRAFELDILKPALMQAEKSLVGHLTASQKKRLEQIRFQYHSNNVYFFPAVQKELHISGEQLSILKDLFIQRIRRDAQWNRQQRQGDAIAKEDSVEPQVWHNERIAKLLTLAQSRKYQEMRGKPISLP